MWNLTLETREPITEDRADQLTDALVAFHPAVHRGLYGGLAVTISLKAEGLPQAVSAGLALTAQAGLTAVSLEAMPTELHDAGPVVLPELVSVPEAAVALGVSRQAVLQRVTTGSLPARRVGKSWVIPARALS